MGMFDIPANIDIILSKNIFYSKVIYIGHGQGGSSILAGMSEKYEYFHKKLKTVILLAPTAKVDNHDSFLLSLAKNLNIIEKLHTNKILEVSNTSLNFSLIKHFPSLIYSMIEMITDEESMISSPDGIKVYMAHFQSGTSLKCLQHFKQVMEAKLFQHFDYGTEENKRRYGSDVPREYDLSKVNDIPIILCGGKKDKLVTIEDIRWLKSKLINKSIFSHHEFEYMGHISFLVNNDMSWLTIVLKDLFKILEQEENLEIKLNSLSNSIENEYLYDDIYELNQEETINEIEDNNNNKSISSNNNISKCNKFVIRDLR
jgi:hypothetical protein